MEELKNVDFLDLRKELYEWEEGLELKHFDEELEVPVSRILPGWQLSWYEIMRKGLKELDKGTTKIISNALKETSFKECIQARVEYLRRLYEDLRERGYSDKRGFLSFQDGKIIENWIGSRPIDVVVNRDGLIYTWDGDNRLAMLHHLGSQKVIKVRACFHSRIKEMLASARTIYGEEAIYQPIEHPVFSNWEIKKKDTRLTLDLIKKRLPSCDGILDIGSCTGFYTSELARHYKTYVVGVESHKLRYEISETLFPWYREYYGKVKFIYGNYESLKIKERFDLVLVLSLLHHYLKEGEERVLSFLEKVYENCRKCVLVEVAHETEEQMLGIRPTPDQGRWIDILGQTRFKEVIPLTPISKRYIFELSK